MGLVVRRRERDIQREILRFLRTVPGIVVWKTGAGLIPTADGRKVRMGHKGVSDLTGWRREEFFGRSPLGFPVARFLAIEVKRPGGKLTVEQQAFLRMVERDGGTVIVASSVEDVARGLGLTR